MRYAIVKVRLLAPRPSAFPPHIQGHANENPSFHLPMVRFLPRFRYNERETCAEGSLTVVRACFQAIKFRFIRFNISDAVLGNARKPEFGSQSLL